MPSEDPCRYLRWKAMQKSLTSKRLDVCRVPEYASKNSTQIKLYSPNSLFKQKDIIKFKTK